MRLQMKITLTAVVVLAVTFAFGLLAWATNGTVTLDFSIIRGPGEHVLYDGPMPVVGETCEVVASDAGNNTSVHPGNNLRLDTGGQTVNFVDVERAPNVSTPGDASVVPAATGTVTLVMGPDETYSSDLILEFTCTPTTTTTQSPTTTSQPTTTTTFGTTTTSEATTTTNPPATSSTSTVPTTLPPDTTVTTDPPVTETLPFTGPAESFGLAALAGVALSVLGVLVVRSGREVDDG